MEWKSGFSVTLFSHPAHENLTAEIFFGENFIGLVSQESGVYQIDFDGYRRSPV